MDKKNLTETEIRTRFITPAITAAGWDIGTVREEFFYFTNGRIEIRGKKNDSQGAKARRLLAHAARRHQYAARCC